MGLVGNVATNSIGEIGDAWKPVIWITLAVLTATVTFTAARNSLRSALDSAWTGDPAEHGKRSRTGNPERMAWQAKAVLTIWLLLAALGFIGTEHVLTTPTALDINTAFHPSFEFMPETDGGDDPLAAFSTPFALITWLLLPFVAGRSFYYAAPGSAGQTTRVLIACAGFVFGGWAAFFGTLAGVEILSPLMPPAAAVYTTLIAIVAVTLIALGWTHETVGSQRLAWQAKAVLVIWALLAALGLVGTEHVLTTPTALDVNTTFHASFQLEPEIGNTWDGSPLPLVAVILAALAWLLLPLVAGRSSYYAFPRSAGRTARVLVGCGGFVFGGWAAFFGTLAGVEILSTVMPPVVAVYTTLIAIVAVTLTASGWAHEAGWRRH
ncbi:MAG: hypothetical protein HOV94_00465 [Saccharothrix sp.]|nr:hypothetical protein [Saccharothrix sp.]